MIVSGEAFSQRLRGLSDDTMLLILEVSKNKETYYQALHIVQTTDTEEEIVKKLNQMKTTPKSPTP